MAHRQAIIPSEEKFRKTLSDKKMKATPQRLAVHRAMTQLIHASAEEVFDYLSANSDVGISSMSVYNTLSQLADEGVYSRRMNSVNRMVFDVISTPHVHLYDKISNEYKDIIDEEAIEMLTKHFKGRRWKGHKLENVDIQITCRPSRTKRNR